MVTRMQPGSRLEGLHGLRGLASLSTVAFHVAYVPQPALALPIFLDRLVPHLGMGVDLFFILSAFVLFHAHGAQKDGWRWILPYLAKRFFRIAPLFYAMLAVYLTWMAWHSVPIDWINVIGTMSFAFNFIPGQQQSIVNAGWTIGVEMPFYILLPLFVTTVRSAKTSLSFFLIILLIGAAVRVGIDHNAQSRYVVLTSFVGNLPVFAMGIVIYHIANEWRPSLSGLIALISLSIIWCLSILTKRAQTFELPGELQVLFWSVPLALLCLWQAIAPSRLIMHRIIQSIGQLSYSIYLTHPFIIWILFDFKIYRWIDDYFGGTIGSWSFAIDIVLTLIIDLPIAWILYSFIEQPGQKLGRWILLKRQSSIQSSFGHA